MENRLCYGRMAVLASAVLILVSCAVTQEAGWVELKPGAISQLHISGTVRHLDVEGGQWVIRDISGAQYDPVNLPVTFQGDGMAVEAEARYRDDRVSIGMVGPLVELLRIRQRPDEAASLLGLKGSAWRLEDLAGTGVIDGVQATLKFSGQGTVHGNASCNRFQGTVSVSGDAVRFGPLAATRMHCVEAVMDQEDRYLKALGEVERYAVQGVFLYLHASGGAQPLRFVAIGEAER